MKLIVGIIFLIFSIVNIFYNDGWDMYPLAAIFGFGAGYFIAEGIINDS